MKIASRLEEHRITKGQNRTPHGHNEGAFDLPGPCGERLYVIASDAADPISEGWEHVSVSTRRRIPNWTEMCFVKALCWEPEEAVVEFHPPQSVYVNNSANCLHMWRPPGGVQLPPPILIGVKSVGTLPPPGQPNSRDHYRKAVDAERAETERIRLQQCSPRQPDAAADGDQHHQP